MINTFNKNDSYDELIRNNDFIIFKFSSPNCIRCTTLHNNLNSLDKNVVIYDVSVIDNKNLIRKLNIYAAPCIMIYYKEERVYRNLGLFDFKEVENIIDKYN